MAGKSWHTGTIKNMAAVWEAEQKAAAEKKRIEELQKELQRERSRKDIMDAATRGSKAQERVDWMYQTPMSAQVSSEEYLTGKAVDTKEEDIAAASTLGLFQAKSANPTQEAWNKVMEDPLFAIQKREKESLDSIKSNPVKMKRIREKLLSLDKGKGKHKKERKKEKREKRERKERKKERREKDSRGDSRDRRESGSHSGREKWKKSHRRSPRRDSRSPRRDSRSPRRDSRRDSRSPMRERREDRRVSGRKSVSGSRSPRRDNRSPRRDQRSSRRDERRRGERMVSRSPKRESRRHSRSPRRDRDYGDRRDHYRRDRGRDERGYDDRRSAGGRERSELGKRGGRDDGGNNASWKRQRTGEDSEKSRGDDFRARENSSSIPGPAMTRGGRGGGRGRRRSALTEEEKRQRLAEMETDAEKKVEHRLAQIKSEKEEEDSEQAEYKARAYEKVDFIDSMNKKIYTESQEDLEDRLRRNKHFRQKGNLDVKAFL